MIAINKRPYDVIYQMAGIFIIIEFYGLSLNHLDEKLTDFNFMEVQFRAQGHGDI